MADNLNDAFTDTLTGQTTGALNDKQTAFLKQEADATEMSLNDREFQELERLNFTGSLNDKWSEHLKSVGSTEIGLGSKGRLLGSTIYGQIGDFPEDWILYTGSWDDMGVWEDVDFWKDGVV